MVEWPLASSVGPQRAAKEQSRDLTEQIRLVSLLSTLSKAIVLILAMGLSCRAAPMQEPEPSKVLLQWVTDARKAGTPEEQIRKNGALAGWQENAVNEALRLTSADLPQNASPQKTKDETAPNVGPAPTAPLVASTQKAPAGPVPSAVAKGGPPPAEKPGAGTEKTPAADRGAPDDYQIGAGDVLHIGVFHEPDATVQSVVVRTDGKISMPLIKEVAVLGLTPSQLEKEITEQLTKFLTAPDVTVIVMSINSKKVYVIGAVRKEGPLTYTYPMNVLQALSESGGLTEFAKRKKIYVLRTKNGKESRLLFDYDAALKGEHIEQNVPLMPGDTIIVPGNQ
jgi:polysaccharide export outer membrane protein